MSHKREALGLKRWLRRGVRFVGLCALAASTVYCLRGLQLDALLSALRGANPAYLALGAMVNFANMGFKSLAWDLLLPQGHGVPRWALFRLNVATGALNVVMPLKAGEAMRVFRLYRHHGVPMPALVSVAATEKVLDVVSLLLLVCPLPFWLPHLPLWVGHALRTATAAATLGVALLWIWLRHRPHLGGPNVRAVAAQVRALGRRLPVTLGIIGLSWCVDWLLIELVLAALGLDLAPILGLLVLFVLNLAIAIPSTPGQMGVLELGASSGLMALGVAQDQALAFGLLYHAAQVLPLLVYLTVDGRFVWHMLGSMRRANKKGAPVPKSA
jgi:uncharacterized membrane protein YbhN (UPF0104 family)